jgi:acyl carrier protein
VTISSRTPEGDPSRCPICGHRVRLEPSIDTRDAPCPSCGHLLWFAEPPSGPGIERAERHSVRQLNLMQRVLSVAIKRFGPAPDAVQEKLVRLGPSKFDKLDWESLFRAKSWNDIESLVNAASR